MGVFALDTGDGAQLSYRAGERFPLCSTFKVIAASAILARSGTEGGLLQQRLPYESKELVEYSPVTEKYVGEGMRVDELCAAAIQYSDNTAANLLMKLLGGPHAVTAFARSIGDREFHLDRWETELNSAIPGDERDTSTPQAMGLSLRSLALGSALAPAQRQQLQAWMRGNTTGAMRIKAGIPADWEIGDKTGTGAYGSANDIAVLWPPGRAPVVLAVYSTGRSPDAKPSSDTIASAARIASDWLMQR